MPGSGPGSGAWERCLGAVPGSGVWEAGEEGMRRKAGEEGRTAGEANWGDRLGSEVGEVGVPWEV